MSTLGGVNILRQDTTVPPSGAWFGTFALDSSALPLVGPTILSVGDLQLVGSIIRTDFDDHPGGALVTATARGGAGWRLPVTRAGSYGGGGVKLSTVLQDLATMTGEPYVMPVDTSLGIAYSWQAHSPVAPVHCDHVLADLIARGYLPTWRVEPFTGRTRFDAWPVLLPADGRGRVTGRSGSRGKRTVGLDVVVAAFLPGAFLEGVQIARTVIRETASSLTVEVYEQ